MLPKGISITSYVNWFASSYESPTGEISNKNININAAIKKSFYWQQPYEKFYKLIILCFEDLNGNGSRENNEPFLPNVNISLRAEKQDLINKKHSRSPNTDLITDISGRVRLKKSLLRLMILSFMSFLMYLICTRLSGLSKKYF